MKPKIYKPVAGQVISARTFLNVSKGGTHNIKHVKFVPPSIGSKGFGEFRVEYRHPVLQPIEDAAG